MKTKNNIFALMEKIKETNDVMTLKFAPLSGEVFNFKPGQFVMVNLLNNELPNLSRAYTISSLPKEKYLSITVKKIGKFSEALHNLKIGDKIQTSEPQGFFCADNNKEDNVFIAGGMGISPFYCIIKDCLQNKHNDKNIYLFYSNKTKNDIIFFQEFEILLLRFKNFKVIYFLTREIGEYSKNIEFKRIDCEILKKYLKNLERKNYYICGRVGFVHSLWQELKSVGVKEENIFTEAFY